MRLFSIWRVPLLLLCVLRQSPAYAQENAVGPAREQARRAPRDSAMQRRLGEVLLRAGRLSEAERQFRKAAKLEPESLEALYDIARVAFARRDHKRARAACRLLSRRDEGATLSLVCEARAFLVWRRSSRALEPLQRALVKTPGHFEALLTMASALSMQGELELASEAYIRAGRAQTARAEPWLGLGRVRLAQKRREEGLEALRTALNKDPAAPETLYELGRALRGSEGKQLLERALAGRPRWNDAALELGRVALEAGDADAAERGFELAARLSAQQVDAFAGLADARLRLGKLDGCDKALGKALKLVPNHYQANLVKADLLARRQAYDDAFEQYEQTSGLKPTAPDPVLRAARLAFSLRRLTLAEGFAEHALRRQPDLAAGLSIKADVAAARGHTTDALGLYRRALRGSGAFDRAHVERRIAQLSSTTVTEF